MRGPHHLYHQSGPPRVGPVKIKASLTVLRQSTTDHRNKKEELSKEVSSYDLGDRSEILSAFPLRSTLWLPIASIYSVSQAFLRARCSLSFVEFSGLLYRFRFSLRRALSPFIWRSRLSYQILHRESSWTANSDRFNSFSDRGQMGKTSVNLMLQIIKICRTI